MSSYTQINYFKPSDEYRSSKVSLDAHLTQLSKAHGLKKSYTGYETEDSTNFFWVNDWTTKDAHAESSAIQDGSHPAFGSQPVVNFVEFEDAEGALGAPITEFVTFTLKEGNTMDQLKPLVDELHRLLKGTPQFHGDSWAPISNKPNAYHGILGWDSVKAHWDAVSGGPLKAVIDKVKLIADLWLVHAALKPFTA